MNKVYPNADPAVDDQLQRNFPRIANARALQIPVRFFMIGRPANALIGRFRQQHCDISSHPNPTRCRQPQFAALRAQL